VRPQEFRDLRKSFFKIFMGKGNFSIINEKRGGGVNTDQERKRIHQHYLEGAYE